MTEWRRWTAKYLHGAIAAEEAMDKDGEPGGCSPGDGRANAATDEGAGGPVGDG
ncbi:hypothetical protein [Streptomyces cinereoruber]